MNNAQVRLRPTISLLRGVAVLVFILVWEGAGRTSSDIAFGLGTPSAAFKELVWLIRDSRLLVHFGITAGEAGLGLLAGVVLGSAVGLAFWFSKAVAEVASPLLVTFGNAPVFAFGPMLIIWFGVGISLKVALAFYFVFFFTISQTHEGAERVSAELEEVFRIFGGSRADAFRKVIVPGALDAVFSAMRRSVALALLGAFVGEFFASSAGLGFVILRAAGIFNIPRAVAGGIAFIALALLFDYIAVLIMRRKAEILQRLAVPKVIRRARAPIAGAVD